jgi:thiol-disulfide isomerase/thioredoxin
MAITGSKGRWGQGWLAVGLVGLFAIATLLLTRPQTPGARFSPLSGLITLQATAQAAMPYDQALGNQRPTLIEFYADWCTTCQALAPTLQTLHHRYGEQVNFVMLNIDDPRWNQQIEQFQVSGVPQITLLRPDHSIIDSFVGKVPRSVLDDRLTTLLKA